MPEPQPFFGDGFAVGVAEFAGEVCFGEGGWGFEDEEGAEDLGHVDVRAAAEFEGEVIDVGHAEV